VLIIENGDRVKTTNILSAYQSVLAIEDAAIDITYIAKMINLANHEARTLSQLCNILIQYQLPFAVFDGYYIGYSIKQIGKEFDLLRFSDDLVINVELKSELNLDASKKQKKIIAQMEQNHYYLTSISRNVLIYTYVENDGLYKYNPNRNTSHSCDIAEVISSLSAQAVNYDIDPDKLFVPSNYLISPFNSTDRFINDEYFLNGTQQNIKKEILKSIRDNTKEFYCISANAGTGKTLLLYDTAKTLMDKNQLPVIVHCGKLNSGHLKLRSEHKWSIVSIASINDTSIHHCIPSATDAILVDESQRIRDHQLELIIERAKALEVSLVFSYDKKQYLRGGETKDLFDYLKQNHPNKATVKKTLTNKIRTNNEMASFITNLFDIGKSNSNLNYDDVTIEYFDDFENAKEYMTFLCNNRGWNAITYTDSTRYTESISKIANICDSNAHDVIGQEFSKVVFVMDKNFRYGNNKLQANATFYSVRGMLYQIVTRVVNELKIIVLDNPELYAKLLEIKALDKQSNG